MEVRGVAMTLLCCDGASRGVRRRSAKRVHILVYRIPFTRMWTNWTTTSGLQDQDDSNE
jgi:hypothetical protein